jgi:hypothetical protein
MECLNVAAALACESDVDHLSTDIVDGEVDMYIGNEYVYAEEVEVN